MHCKTKTAAVALAFILGAGSSLLAQQKGQYVPGQVGLNAGLIPDPGFTYGNMTLNSSASRLNNSSANAVPGIGGVYGFWANENFFYYVPHFKVLGGHFAPFVILPFANGSLTASGPLGIAPFGINAGGTGLADIWVQPLNIGWHFSRVDFSVGDGFVAPTGRYSSAPGTTNNVGSGYWTPVVSGGQTFYLSKNRATALSAFQMYEFHGTQQGTMIHPGQTLNFDYSLTQVFPLQGNLRFQLGLVGYGQWQTTDKRGPTITLEQAAAHYKVNALGFAANVMLPERKVSVGVKYFREFECRSTFQGYTLQISGAVTF